MRGWFVCLFLLSRVAAPLSMNLGYVTVEHQRGALTIRNHSSVARYDRSYQNYVPGAVSASQTLASSTTAPRRSSSRTRWPCRP